MNGPGRGGGEGGGGGPGGGGGNGGGKMSKKKNSGQWRKERREGAEMGRGLWSPRRGTGQSHPNPMCARRL